MSLVDGEPESTASETLRQTNLELCSEPESTASEILRQTILELANKPHKINLKTRIKPRTI